MEETGPEMPDIKTLADVMPKQMPASGVPDMTDALPEDMQM